MKWWYGAAWLTPARRATESEEWQSFVTRQNWRPMFLGPDEGLDSEVATITARLAFYEAYALQQRQEILAVRRGALMRGLIEARREIGQVRRREPAKDRGQSSGRISDSK